MSRIQHFEIIFKGRFTSGKKFRFVIPGQGKATLFPKRTAREAFEEVVDKEFAKASNSDTVFTIHKSNTKILMKHIAEYSVTIRRVYKPLDLILLNF